MTSSELSQQLHAWAGRVEIDICIQQIVPKCGGELPKQGKLRFRSWGLAARERKALDRAARSSVICQRMEMWSAIQDRYD